MGYSPIQSQSPKFELGRAVATSGVTHLILEHQINIADYLHRHHHGDWGDVCDEDKRANDLAVASGSRIVSKYRVPLPTGKTKEIFIITEWDRSATTVLLTHEY